MVKMLVQKGVWKYMDAPIYTKVHEIDLALHCFYFAWYVGGIFIVDDISNFIAEIALMGCDDIKISSQM